MTRILSIIVIAIVFFLLLEGKPFRDYSYEELESRAFNLTGAFSHVSSAEDLLHIKRARDGQSFSCSPAIIHVTHTASIDADTQRPQLIISGEIHGDERVGPSASIFLAELLVHAARCELDGAQDSCMFLKPLQLTAEHRVWMAFLATRRDTIIIPTANCLGYKHSRRSENGVDPNRDFAYMRSDNNCERSITAQIFVSIMLSSIVQIVVTFHAGMVAIGYEWGSRNHLNPHDSSPDDKCNSDVALGMTRFAGTFPREQPYPVGPINSLVYPVEGGMEDWLYAGGWDKSQLRNCSETSAKGSDGIAISSRSNENNNNSGPRALVFLVETSDMKRPDDLRLGASDKILSAEPGNIFGGHVPRNVRLSLVALDVVQPYVCIAEALSTATTVIASSSSFSGSHSDGASSSSSIGDKHDTSESASVAHTTTTTVNVSWYVGGAFTVDATWLTLHAVVSTASTGRSSEAGTTVNETTEGSSHHSHRFSSWSSYVDKFSPPGYAGGSRTVDPEHFESRVIGHRKVSEVFMPDKAVHKQGKNSFREKKDRRKRSTRVKSRVRRESEGENNLIGNGENRLLLENTDSRSSRTIPLSMMNVSAVFSGPARWGGSASGREKASTPLDPHLFSASVTFRSHLLSDGSRHTYDGMGATFNLSSEVSVYQSDGSYVSITLPPGEYWLVVWAVVDQRWGSRGQGHPKYALPQSHLVRARTMSGSYGRVADSSSTGSLGAGDVLTAGTRTLKRRTRWPSEPLLIHVPHPTPHHTHRSRAHVSAQSYLRNCAWWKDEPVDVVSRPSSSTATSFPNISGSSSVSDMGKPGVGKYNLPGSSAPGSSISYSYDLFSFLFRWAASQGHWDDSSALSPVWLMRIASIFMASALFLLLFIVCLLANGGSSSGGRVNSGGKVCDVSRGFMAALWMMISVSGGRGSGSYFRSSKGGRPSFYARQRSSIGLNKPPVPIIGTNSKV